MLYFDTVAIFSHSLYILQTNYSGRVDPRGHQVRAGGHQRPGHGDGRAQGRGLRVALGGCSGALPPGRSLHQGLLLGRRRGELNTHLLFLCRLRFVLLKFPINYHDC